MSVQLESFKTVQIVFFSGTGGVKRIANSFHQELLRRGCEVGLINLDCALLNKDKSQPSEDISSADLIILLFPLHAFDAPDPIYEWIQHTRLTGKKLAVISVSGGGEAWPNTGCRNKCCRALERKGFEVVYEHMMCMPCNWVFPVNDHAAMWMIKVIPGKVNRILDDLFSGKTRRTKSGMGFFRASITQLEKRSAKRFAKGFTIDSSCTGCGWCAGHCPVNNIEMKDQRPGFKENCVMCFRCIYGCPARAIKSTSFQILKGGYSLDEVEKRMRGVELEPVEKCCKGWFWSGIRNYLLDKDGC
jgi:ferredoxin